MKSGWKKQPEHILATKRKQALAYFEMQKEDKLLDNSDAKRRLAAQLEVNIGTLHGWYKKWRLGVSFIRKTHDSLPLTPVTPAEVTEGEPTALDQLIQSVGSVDKLGIMLLDGFMAKLDKQDSVIHTQSVHIQWLTESVKHAKADKEQVLESLNEEVKRGKLSGLTLADIRARVK
jgi:hypothetical protein